jgi:hypothetical protein
MKKPRADAKLLNLPEEQQAQLAEWLLGGMPYHSAREAVRKEFGVEVRSLSAFSVFYSEVCRPQLLRRRAMAATTADEIAAEAEKSPAQFDRATVDAIRQKAFELAISPMSSPADVKALFMLLQKSRDQDLKVEGLEIARRRLDILERRESQSKDVLTNTALSPEEKAARMKQIFGLQ